MLPLRACFASLCVCFTILLPAGSRAQDAPAFTGFITSAAGHTPLLVDGRPLLLSHTTSYACGNSTQSEVDIDNDIPKLPEGAQVAVTGKWDTKALAWRTDALCVTALPPKTVHGQGSLDAVIHSGTDMELTVDGRRLYVTSAASLTFQPSPTSATVLTPGQWLQYAADRRPDGSWLLRNATVRDYLNNRAARSQRKWKPLNLTPPIGGHEGSIKLSHLTSAIKLSGDAAMQERLARVGATVVPTWEKALGAQYQDEHQFHFYASKQHTMDCFYLPDGTILLAEGTAKMLPEDAELAAILAGCVAAVEEEQTAVYANKELAVNSVEAANYLELVIPAGFIAGSVYQHHLKQLMDQQCTRVALSYLQTAGYSASAGPAAWEKLEGKHGQLDLSRPPGTRTGMMYQAITEAAR